MLVMEIIENKKMYERILHKIKSDITEDSIGKMKNDIKIYSKKFKILEDTINNMKVIFDKDQNEDYYFEEFCSDFDESDYEYDGILKFSEDVIGSLEIKRDGLKKLITDTNSKLNTAQEEKEMIEFVKNIIADLDSKLLDKDPCNTSRSISKSSEIDGRTKEHPIRN